MLSAFLENKAHTVTIAKTAIIFQSVVTILVSMCLFGVITKSTLPIMTLKWLLYVDGVFVLFHLLYRAVYRGPKVVLKSNVKITLLVHSVSSLTALMLTGFFVQQGLRVEFYYIWFVIFMWAVSLTSGVTFFQQKYQSVKRL